MKNLYISHQSPQSAAAHKHASDLNKKEDAANISQEFLRNI